MPLNCRNIERGTAAACFGCNSQRKVCGTGDIPGERDEEWSCRATRRKEPLPSELGGRGVVEGELRIKTGDVVLNYDESARVLNVVNKRDYYPSVSFL